MNRDNFLDSMSSSLHSKYDHEAILLDCYWNFFFLLSVLHCCFLHFITTQGEPVLYQLYGVVVHSGHSPDHGHYYAYVKAPNKTWYCMNDSSVSIFTHPLSLEIESHV